MSRMKKRPVIVACESVFEITPSDADGVDQTLIWKRLYIAGVTEKSPVTAVWNGQLDEFCPSVSIYREGAMAQLSRCTR